MSTSHLRRSPTQDRGRERVERILDAAAEIVVERGPESLKVSDIAARAGVHLGTLYHFFASKDDIIRALAERFAERFGKVLDDILAECGEAPDWAVLLNRLFDAYAAHYRTEPALRELWVGAQLDPQFIAADHEYTNRQFASKLAHALAPTATVSETDLALMVYVCWESMQALLETAFRANADGDPQVLGQAKLMAARYLSPAF
ncbi:MAG TPA: TetR/AcrR family transcriptional regulator [Mycobacterium sp.]|jgi:AcrR family transcriptional regulator|nr:TetR/AcrR family transcriptional regulator [Mycobacterium sp.]